MKIPIIVIISVLIGGLAGFILGKKFSFLDDKTIGELDELAGRIEQLNKNSYSPLVRKSSIFISVLKSLDDKNEAKARETIINELGDTYYIYTYEDERDLNPPEIENILLQIDELAKTSQTFMKVKQYKRTE